MQQQILIIDDDSDFRHLLRLRLNSFLKGAACTECATLAQARTYLSSNPPLSLVVLDQHLPDGKGISLLQEGFFRNFAVLAVSSDAAPEIPGSALEAGATFFLNKQDIHQALFEPLVRGIIQRNRLQQDLLQARLAAAKIETVRTLISTLRHEIRNPLGAALGAAYLLKNLPGSNAQQQEAAALVEASNKRISHVLDELCNAVELDTAVKGDQTLFQVPGDKPWQKT